MAAVITAPPLDAATHESVRSRTREQVEVAAGQLLAGTGNLAFAFVMARVLAPSAYSRLAAFLALYALVGLPTTSLSAAAALAPDRTRTDRQSAAVGLVLGAALAAGSPWIGPAVHLPIGVVAALGVAGPSVGPLAVARGRLYGRRRHGRLVTSLLAEPAVRLGIGVAAGLVFGAVGGAAAVVLGGYAALEIARRVHGAGTAPAAAGALASGRGAWAAVTFLLLALIQNQDLLIANRLLRPTDAGLFAVLSTLGGVVAFASVTVPLVLLAPASQGRRHTLPAGLAVAGGMGLAAVAVAAAIPTRLVTTLFGPRYAPVAPLVALYLGAMALLGIVRVIAAYWCAVGAAGAAAMALVAAGAAQAFMIVDGARSPSGVAHATFYATAGAVVVLGGGEAAARMDWRRPSVPVALRRIVANPVVPALAAATLLAVVVRVVVPRGLWVDEATSVFQAKMPFHAMLANLRGTDVHPPLYFAVLWATVHLLGSGEAAVRLPSLVCGVLLVPALYMAGTEVYDRRTGVVAGVLGSVSPFLVWYSQEARMYALFMLLAVLAVWAQARCLRRGRAIDWALYAVVSAAMVWTQYFALLQVGVQQVWFIAAAVRRKRAGEPVGRYLAGWLLSAIAIAGALVPLAPFAYHQFHVNQATGKGFGSVPAQAGTVSSAGTGMSIYALLANVVWALIGYHSDAAMAAVVALWPVGMLLAVLALGRRRQSLTTLLVAVCLVPVLALFVLGEVKRDLFDARYFSGAVAISVLLLARMVTTARRRKAVIASCLVAVCVLAASLFDEQTNGSNPRRYSFREAVRVVNADARTGDRLLFSPAYLSTVVGYYDRGRYTIAPLGPAPPGRTPGHDWVLVSTRLMSPAEAASAGRILSVLRSRRPVVQKLTFDNVIVWEFGT